METRIQDLPGYYVWEVPGEPVAVHLRLDVVDRLAAEVTRGFNAIPKRGAEVGGVLLGTIENGSPAIVRVEAFESIACDYGYGPSYQFTEEDGAKFEDACRRWQSSEPPLSYAVGYFRSHTREGFSLESDDIELLDHFFASPSHVALLIKPSAKKVSVAGFFARKDGVFPQSTPLEFPFRRGELTGEVPPLLEALMEPRPQPPDLASLAALAEQCGDEPEDRLPEWIPDESVRPAVPPPSSEVGSGWMWIPLSFIFLLVGTILGFHAAPVIDTSVTANSAQDLSLALSVTQNDNSLSLKWDRLSPAVRGPARKGTVEIEEGGRTKPVDLDSAQLQNGTLIYRNTSNSVRFRLTVYPNARVSISETLNWKR